MSVKQSHSFSIGIVGLPNVGKSTIFNALTEMSVPAENFPFCTIDKNVGIVEIPDLRLKRLSEHFNAEKVVPSAIKFVDIAGLVRGASKGEGLGNQFLSHIREVDIIMYVLRAFDSESITHVYDRINPLEDFEIVQAELIFKDIESVQKRLGGVQKMGRLGDKASIEELSVLEKVMQELDNGVPVVDMNLEKEELSVLADLHLLTRKRRLFVLNSRAGVDSEKVMSWKEELEVTTGDTVVITDVKLMQEMSEMEDSEIEEYLQLLDYKPSTGEDVVKEAFKALNLITFYTGSEKECNAWSIEGGRNVREAAGVIHTDLMESFITADVVNVEEMLDVGGWVPAKEKGLIKNHSREYVVRDGDYIIILANTR